MGVVAAIITSAIIGAGTSVYQSKQQDKAMKAQNKTAQDNARMQAKAVNDKKSALQQTQGQLVEEREDDIELGADRNKTKGRRGARSSLMAKKGPGNETTAGSMPKQSTGVQI
jgi:hypothetical protein